MPSIKAELPATGDPLTADSQNHIRSAGHKSPSNNPADMQTIIERLTTENQALRADHQAEVDRQRAESQVVIDRLTAENRRLKDDKLLLAVKYQGVQEENEDLKQRFQEKENELAIALYNAVHLNNDRAAVREPYLDYGYEDDIREEYMGDGCSIQPPTPCSVPPDFVPPGYFTIAELMPDCIAKGVKISAETIRRRAHAGKYGEVERLSSSGELLINGDRFIADLLATKRVRSPVG